MIVGLNQGDDQQIIRGDPQSGNFITDIVTPLKESVL
jgi:hypothetical protein